jgi:hypothetical protein
VLHEETLPQLSQPGLIAQNWVVGAKAISQQLRVAPIHHEFISRIQTLEGEEVTNAEIATAPSTGWPELQLAVAIRQLCGFVLLFLMTLIPAMSRAQSQTVAKHADPAPEAAIPAILAAFDKYEIVGLPQGHGMQDLDDFIFSLIRNPAFSAKVNDIEVECGNSLYQPMLDRYIAGENVPFKEVQKVWRKMGQPACGASAFVEQFFPLVRALNQRLPPGRRLRVLAGDSPVDWDQIKSSDDIIRLVHRDASIASVMEKEVLSKHRKALMLFGTFHLMHGVGGSAVSIYEKDYPNLTFINSDLGTFDTDLPSLSESKFIKWPIPSLAPAKGTWLGALDLSQFLPPPTRIDQDCNVHHAFPKVLQKPMEDLVDAFLYLGPQDLRLREKIPADIALDVNYRTELQRGGAMLGFPDAASGTVTEFEQQVVNSASDPLFVIPKPKDTSLPDPELSKAVQTCLESKGRSNPPQ